MARKRSMNLGEAINRAVRGPRTPRTTTTYRQVKDLIKAFGEQGAAQRLGVGVRTVRSWVHKDRSRRRSPSKANQAKIGREHNTRDVRAATMPRRRAARFSRKGIRVQLNGLAGPLIAGKDYRRIRQVTADLPPEAAQAIMDAYVEGGREGAEQAFQDAMREHYHDQPWGFDDLDRMDFRESGMFDDDGAGE